MDDAILCGFLIVGFTYLFTPLSKYLFSKNKLYIKYNRENALEPFKGSIDAAGYDLFSCENGIIHPHSKAIIDIGISLVIPNGYYGRIAPRSGLTLKHSINVGAGVIDSDYRGNISVILFNHSDDTFTYKEGDKIAQLIIEKIGDFEFQEVYDLNNFESERGLRGFGSTGLSNNNYIIKYYTNEYKCEDESSEEESTEEEDNQEDTNEDTNSKESKFNEKTTSIENQREDYKSDEENKETTKKQEDNTEENTESSQDEETKEFIKVE